MRLPSRLCSTRRLSARWTRMRPATTNSSRGRRSSGGSGTRGGRAGAEEAQAGSAKGYNTPKAEIERQEQIKEAMEYRLMGYTYRLIAEQMEVAPSTAYKWVVEALADITQETAEELRRVM